MNSKLSCLMGMGHLRTVASATVIAMVYKLHTTVYVVFREYEWLQYAEILSRHKLSAWLFRDVWKHDRGTESLQPPYTTYLLYILNCSSLSCFAMDQKWTVDYRLKLKNYWNMQHLTAERYHYEALQPTR